MRRRTRLVVLVAATAVVAGSCVGLGVWQLGRLSDRRALNERLVFRTTQPVLETLPSLTGGPEDPSTYRRVRLSGTYDVANEIILRARPVNERPGNHVLTPMRLKDGRAVIVDRGWVPLEIDAPGAATAAPPDGSVLIEGTIVPTEKPPRLFGARDPAEGRLRTIARLDISRIAKQLPYRIEPLAVVRYVQQPPGQELPLIAGVTPPGEGPHKAYAIQWFLLGGVAATTGTLLALRERRRG